MKYTVALLCLCFSCTLFAQEVKWGRPHQKPDKNLHISQVVGKTTAGIFTLLTDMRTPAILPPVLQRFNGDLKLEKQVPLRLHFPWGDPKLETVVILKDRLHLLLGWEDEALQKYRVYTQEIDLETLQPIRAPRPIYEINWEKGVFEQPVGFKPSKDHSKLLIFNRFPYASGNWMRNWLLVCDDDLLPVWGVEPKFPWENETIHLIDYEIDNNGAVYVLATHQEQNKTKVATQGQYSTLVYFDQGRKLKWYDFNLGAATPQQMELELNNKGGIICGGLLGNRLGESIGSFVISIDLNNGGTQTHIHSFDPKELQQLAGSPKRLPDFQLKALHLEPDGNVSLLAEQFLPPFKGNAQRFYGEVLLVTYPADLNDRKLHMLSKNQVSFDQGYFDSFAYLVKGEQHLLLYNDKSKSPMRKASFTNDGSENTPLECPFGGKIKVRPSNCAAISNEAMWIYAETVDKKQYQVGLLEF